MNIFDTHRYKLRFSIVKYASEESHIKWQEFKNICESGNNKRIVEEVKDNCVLEQNKILPYLDRVEGGFGGNNNITNKQIRFRAGFYSDYQLYKDNDIILNQIFSTETEKWTYEELDDLVSAFIKVVEDYIEEKEYIRGCIEMTNRKIYIH
jgi:hypothetical protein